MGGCLFYIYIMRMSRVEYVVPTVVKNMYIDHKNKTKEIYFLKPLLKRKKKYFLGRCFELPTQKQTRYYVAVKLFE